MTKRSDSHHRYQITVGGDCRELLAGGIDGIEVTGCQNGTTTAVVIVRDDAEFYGLLDRLQDFALHLVSLTELSWNGAHRQAETAR